VTYLPTFKPLETNLKILVFIHHARFRTGFPALLRSEFQALHDLLNATHTAPSTEILFEKYEIICLDIRFALSDAWINFLVAH